MTRITTIPGVQAGPAPESEQRLRGVAAQLEGVFVEQLFKAMRETVPDGGIASGGAGEEMFSGLMDQHLAAEAPKQWHDGLGDALYRQLRPKLDPPPPATPPAAGTTSPKASTRSS